MSSFSGAVGIFHADFVIAFFLFTVVIRISPFKYKNITSNIKSEMIHTISIALNKHMFYNGLNKKLKSVQRDLLYVYKVIQYTKFTVQSLKIII